MLKKLDLTDKETVDIFVEAVNAEPLLWSAWLELSLLISDREMVIHAVFFLSLLVRWRNSRVSACWTFDPAVGVPVPLAAGGRVAIVGQLLFAPWVWAYSALHP